MTHPFHHGNPVTTPNFLGRKKALSRISQRIYSSQSIAIVSEPRTGKSSLLLHLTKPENHPDLHSGGQQPRRFFSFLDTLAFDDQINQGVFWALAFAPLFSALIQPHPQSTLADLYQNCRSNNFNHHSLSLLFNELANKGYYLILLLDEFDVLLNFPGLCSSGFLGSLRSLASINPALSLVIASRQSISQLNSLTQQLNSTGSPFFNIFEECVLSPFTEEEAELLLSRANGRFSPADKAFIIHAAGTQPYLLQVIAAELWSLYEDGDVTDPDERRNLAAQVLQDTAAATLKNSWSAWSPQTRMAITVVALASVHDKNQLKLKSPYCPR
jgi:hypothetical protein